MSIEHDGEEYEVQDDGNVDNKLKRRIINARQRVDDREDYLYVEAPVEDNKSVNSVQQDIYWGMIVKQFLRTISPLLRSEELDELATEYREEIELGQVNLIPRDTADIPFSDWLNSNMSETRFKRRYKIRQTADLPEPRAVKFVGLESVIQSDGVVSATWSLTKEGGDVVQTSDEQPIPRQIYERALTEADDFLQQAGIGIEIGSGRPMRNYG